MAGEVVETLIKVHLIGKLSLLIFHLIKLKMVNFCQKIQAMIPLIWQSELEQIKTIKGTLRWNPTNLPLFPKVKLGVSFLSLKMIYRNFRSYRTGVVKIIIIFYYIIIYINNFLFYLSFMLILINNILLKSIPIINNI